MRKLTTFALGVILAGMVSTGASAHFLWLNVDNYNPKVGEEITITVGYGHKFPMDGEARAGKLAEFYLVDPEGKIIPLKIKAKGERGVEPVKVRLEKAGTYLAVLTKKSGFVSKTTKGYFYKPKNKLRGVLASYWSEGSAKAIINVGSPGGLAFQKEIQQRYQIIPLKDPGRLQVGEYFPVRINFREKPEGTKYNFVYATYAGFSDQKNTFCYATTPDEKGIAQMKLLHPGIWLLYAPEKIPYPNPKKADQYSFTSTITFAVK